MTTAFGASTFRRATVSKPVDWPSIPRGVKARLVSSIVLVYPASRQHSGRVQAAHPPTTVTASGNGKRDLAAEESYDADGEHEEGQESRSALATAAVSRRVMGSKYFWKFVALPQCAAIHVIATMPMKASMRV